MLSNTEANKPCRVGLTSRSVPSGVFENDLKLSLAFQLRIPETGGVNFAKLPSRIFKQLGAEDLELQVIPISGAANECLMPPDPTKMLKFQADKPLLKVWSPESEAAERHEEITSLWARVMPKREGDDFQELCDGLYEYGKYTEESPQNSDNQPKAAIPNFSGQIALACQIERALVEKMSVFNRQNWQLDVVTQAVKAANEFVVEYETHLQGAYPQRPDNQTNEKPSPKNSLAVSTRKEIAAKAITEATTQASCVASQKLGAALCGEETVAKCREALRQGPATPNVVAKMAKCSFADIIKQLLLLNQFNIRASAMGRQEAEELEKTLQQKDDDGEVIKEGVAFDARNAPQPPGTIAKLRFALSRIKELETNTEFARLFGLVLDFKLSDTVRDELKKMATVVDPFGAEAAYFYVRVAPKNETAANIVPRECSHWTIAKFTQEHLGRDGKVKRRSSFAPTSREEVAVVLGCGGQMDAHDCEVLPSIDGVRLLSAKADGQHPRYELSSIDARDTMQDLDTRMSQLLSHVIHQRVLSGGNLTADDYEAVAQSYMANRPTDEPWPLAALKSRSLRLYHFHEQCRLDVELGKTNTLTGKSCDDVALDSEDLSIGWLYDSSPRCFGDNKQLKWYPLSATRIKYHDPSKKIQDLDKLIGGFFRGGERVRYQRSSTALASRVKQEAGEDSNNRVAVGDDLQFEYAGEQQGTDIAVGDWKPSRAAFVQQIKRHALLDIGRTYPKVGGPEGLGPEDLPPELVNGLGYYLGVREIRVGGGCTPDDVAQTLLNEIPCAPVPRLSGEGVEPGHRLVRTEKVTRPLVLLDGGLKHNRPGNYNRKFLPSTTREVVLRSKWDNDREQYRNPDSVSEERLVLVPGTVDLEMAHRHGSFSSSSGKYGPLGRPHDGLRTVRMDSETGGWATLDHVTESGSEILLSRTLNYSGKTNSGRKRRQAASNALFVSGGNVDDRKVQYYPDPLHNATALRLRIPGSKDKWIGKPVIVKQPKKIAYPNTQPISLRITKSDLDQPLRMKVVEKSARVQGIVCTVVELELPPGMAAELVVWPVPDLAAFALMSEAVTLQALLAIECELSKSPIDGIPVAECSDAVVDCLTNDGAVTPAAGSSYCGIACSPAPGASQLLKVANLLRGELLKRPLDVVCGHSVVNLTHAVDRPVVKPVAHLPPANQSHQSAVKPAALANPKLMARRADPDQVIPVDDENALIAKPGAIPADFFGEGHPGLTVSGRGVDVDLAGFVRIDAMSTNALEVEVTTESPVSGIIDDPLRARSPSSRRSGLFPTDGNAQDGKVMRAEKLYGFKVFPDHSVETVRNSTRLARFSRIPRVPVDCKDLAVVDLAEDGWLPEPTYLALHTLFSLAENTENAAEGTTAKSADNIQVDIDPVLAFSQSRWLQVKFKAFGRYMREMTPRKVRDDQRPPSADITVEGEEEWVPVPSSKRPDPPVRATKVSIVATPEKILDSETGFITLETHQTVRCSFRRPFMTSGLEKIGIVLSPRPSSFAEDGRYAREFDGSNSDKLDMFRLAERFPDPQNLPADLADRLTRFADKGTRPPLYPHPDHYENGPYGLFPLPLPIFADGSFDDYGNWQDSEDIKAGYVANVQLPIYSDSHIVERNKMRPKTFYPVDLLLYEPHFDMASETWFCDITLDPRHTLDPHLQLGVVRYQPLAPPDLQVSPIGEPLLCPVLPKRSIEIRRSETEDNDIISIVISGPGANEKMAGRDLGPRTRFMARIMGSERFKAHPGHRHLDLSEEVILVEKDCWRTSFVIPKPVARSLRTVLHIEELEDMARSTMSIEPAFGDDAMESLSRGPRFQTSIELTDLLDNESAKVPATVDR